MPEPGHGEVLVKVEAVGICAGDAKTYDGATRFWGNYNISKSLNNNLHQVMEKEFLAMWSHLLLQDMNSLDVL